MKLTTVAALLSTASSCCSMAAAFSTTSGAAASTVRHHFASQLMQQYGGEDQSQYYDNQQQQPEYYDEQQQNQHYYDGQQQQQQEEEEPSLLITDNMQQEMQRATANSDIGGLDYLALARQRAAARVESVNNQSTAADWQKLADEKAIESGGYVSEDEDWEASLGEEGSESDFNSLGMGAVSMVEGEGGVMMTEGGLVVDNMDGGDEPQLLF
ncbi:hypothetical protein QTG54_003825 [Skeletonema marinoi]|uniref:Uncharacterized protein n=1 Tax=Skeletonema marinoi TaxID=267567 RepID=A0AAD9DFL3_9STRA|nr:hypothetical protein QTG54_003825 [Skeletonema marinoi]